MTQRIALFAGKALTRLVAVGMAYVSGTALNAALSGPTGLSAGYAVFALIFIGLAALVWKVAGR